MEEELNGIETELKNSPGEWQWHVAQMITTIPSGQIATYGAIAEAVNRRHRHRINARNVAWLEVPLHRVAKAGDVESLADSAETKEINDVLRGREGSLQNPVWWTA